MIITCCYIFQADSTTSNGTWTSRKRKKRGTEESPPEGLPKTILEYAINPAYKKDSESLGVQAIRNVLTTFDGMDEKGYRNLFEILWYKQLPCFDVRNTTSAKNNQHGMIKQCEWKGHSIPCSAIFQTTPTDRGMCCTFNVQEAEKMFKDKEYRVRSNIFLLPMYVALGCYYYSFLQYIV